MSLGYVFVRFLPSKILLRGASIKKKGEFEIIFDEKDGPLVMIQTQLVGKQTQSKIVETLLNELKIKHKDIEFDLNNGKLSVFKFRLLEPLPATYPIGVEIHCDGIYRQDSRNEGTYFPY